MLILNVSLNGGKTPANGLGEKQIISTPISSNFQGRSGMGAFEGWGGTQSQHPNLD